MSLYNMVFGTNPALSVALFLLQKEPGYFGRFRDAWVEKSQDGKFMVAVYTRNGGGNRQHYDDEEKAGPGCGCTGCIMAYRLPEDPLYLCDKDDEFDYTYATVYFKVPSDAETRLHEAGLPADKTLADLSIEPRDMDDEWNSAIATL